MSDPSTQGQPPDRIARDPLTYGEQITVASYEEGVKAALASTDSACEKILTAAISLTTVYGAVIALVVPKDQTTDWKAVPPFAGFALAVVLCMWAQTQGIKFAPDDGTDTLKSHITGIIDKKRKKAVGAVIVLAISLIGAGVVVSLLYGKAPSEEKAQKASITLSPEAHRAVSRECGSIANPVQGTIEEADLPTGSVTISVSAKECPNGTHKFSIPTPSVMLVQIATP
ncbi:hypothetical protein [Streptomyces canus]|uniref:hypothetical protein n=1 Tax=Streptomyces canus TaxID=58343 RepID=UPI000AB99CDD|nr:hypothetical protein [Streptomyces canus]